MSHNSEFLGVRNKHVDDGGQSQYCSWISSSFFARSGLSKALKSIRLECFNREDFPVAKSKK